MPLFVLNIPHEPNYIEEGEYKAIWAKDADSAIVFYRTLLSSIIGVDTADDIRVVVTPTHLGSEVQPVNELPYEELSDNVLRDLYFRCEGDACCDTCMRYTLDNRFPVCENCNNCKDCGCTCGGQNG